MSTEVRRSQRQYVDISLAFSPHPLTGDLPVLRDKRAINAALKNCVMIATSEKPFQPDFGSQITEFLFDFCDQTTANLMNEEIIRTIEYNEPRVELIEVQSTAIPENNEFRVEIKYKIIGGEDIFTFETLLVSTR